VAKKRTRKQKEKAISHLKSSLERSKLVIDSKPFVKREFKTGKVYATHEAKNSKSARSLAKDDSWATTKRDIIKSLSLASLMLILTLVIYLAWK
jgi:hypothetical protein